MFSKNDKKLKKRATQLATKPWSMTSRLLSLYFVVTFTILLLIVSTLFWMLGKDLLTNREESLKHDIWEIEILLQDIDRNKVLLETEIHQFRKPGELVSQDETSYIRVMNQAGEVIFQTDGMADRLPIVIFPLPKKEGMFTDSPLWESNQNRPYILTSIKMDIPLNSGQVWLIQGAEDVSKTAELISNYRRKSLILLFIGILLSSGLAAVATKFGIKPLREITDLVRHITIERLNQRLESERWPKELSEMAKAFDQMLEGLEASFIKLNQFSADLAHELRTPVNILMGEAEVALSRTRSDEEYRQVLESALEEYTELARLIDNLLFLARAENTHDNFERLQLDARQEIEAIRTFYEAVTEEKGVTVICEGQAYIMADPILLRRALSNLLSNALRHTPEGGKITITARPLTDGTNKISVNDTGSGIPPNELPKIFERFYRIDEARERQKGGTGLGLSIVKSIMILHGGNVEVESHLGVGTTVSLYFPKYLGRSIQSR